MMGSVVAFTCMGLIIKVLADQMSVWTMSFFRQSIALIIVLPYALRVGIRNVATAHMGAHVFRAFCAVGSFVTLAYALGELILANAVALAYTNPLWSILTAVLFLKERVRARRWTATVIGFMGVLLIVRPQGQVDPAMLAALLSAVFAAMSLTVVKRLTATETAFQVVFHYSWLGTLIAVGPALATWTTPTPTQLAWLVAISLLAVAGQLCMARALRQADLTLIMPLDFVRLPLAAAIGLLLFDEVPTAWTLAGTAVIACSCAYIARREAVLKDDRG